MIMRKKVLVICCVSVAMLVAFPLAKVFAESNAISDQQITIIKTNCSQTKSSLNQVRVSDTVLRVNTGQSYDSMSSKLMSRFNDRTSSNNLKNSDLIAATKKFDSTLDTFRSDYKIYAEQLSLAIGIDCSTRPTEFYNAVDQANKYRSLVYADVIKLNDCLDQYQLALDQFEKDYQATATGGTK